MKLSELSTKPKLMKLTIDDEDIVKEYGEPIDFWVYDRQPMKTFMSMATVADGGENVGELAELVCGLVLDEKGNPMIKEGEEPPANVLMKVITLVVGTLGNSNSQTSKS